MKFTAEIKPLLAAVKRAAAVTEGRNTIPILGCVYVVATDTGLRVTGTNLDEWLTAKCDAAVASPGKACIDARLLSAWLAAAPKGALVSMDFADHRVSAVAGAASASFATLPIEDYPVPSKTDKGVELVGAIPALAACLPFVSAEEVRYYLNGVAVSFGHAVAADGHRLCAVDIQSDHAIVAIIPSRAVAQIILCGSQARLWVSERAWACEDDGIRMGGKLIDGTFPDWRRLMPKDAETVATVDADALAESLSMVVMAAQDKVRAVKFTGDGETINMLCRGGVLTAAAATPYEGAAFDAGLNSKYAASGIAAFSGRVMKIHKSDNLLLLTCDAAPEVRVVLMEMRI